MHLVIGQGLGERNIDERRDSIGLAFADADTAGDPYRSCPDAVGCR